MKAVCLLKYANRYILGDDYLEIGTREYKKDSNAGKVSLLRPHQVNSTRKSMNL
jgi:hypothetical protein